MEIYIASLNGIREGESKYGITEHVDAGIWEAYAENAERAKQLLCDALQKRVQGTLQSWELARDRFQKAQTLQLP